MPPLLNMQSNLPLQKRQKFCMLTNLQSKLDTNRKKI